MNNAESEFKLKRIRNVFWAAELAMLFCLFHRLFISPNTTMAITFFVCVAVIALSYIPIKLGKAEIASMMLMGIFTLACFGIMLRSDGLRDEAILGLPGILMFSALLGTAKLFYGLLFFMVSAIASIGLLTKFGMLEMHNTVNEPANALLVIVGLGVVSYSVWLMSKDLRRVLKRLSEENQLVKESKAEIQKLVHHDALTGLPNRVLAREYFDKAMSRTQRNHKFLCMLFIDLDNFKSINDSLGHHTGDLLLVEVAKRLKTVVRKMDIIARLGGDEFLVLLDSIQHKEQISNIAQNIVDALYQPYVINQQEMICTCSIGVAIAPDDGDDFDTLLKNTDMAMYAAKKEGKNHFHFFDSQMNENALERLSLMTDLHKALKNQELQLHYQPKYDLSTGQLVGAEALMRWLHPEKGLIPPNQFIPLAEASGLILEMGSWAIEQACRDCQKWNQNGHPDISVAVNTSSLQFKRGDISDTVKQALKISNLVPSNLELELTESMLVDNSKALKQALDDLKSIDIKFSIDDFGTGYSNLRYLKEFNFDALKIDRSFIKTMKENDQDTAIVNTIIQIASNLSLKTIAEGIEDEESAELLRSMGCDQAQGFLWSKPIVESEFSDLLGK